jgi:putative endonuclease
MKSLGDAAEQAAERYLQQHGLRVLARNWRTRLGELDLVCDDRGTLVFVEVRRRSASRFGGAAASITPQKQARLVAAAQQYLATLARMPACRFDAVLLDGDKPIQWLQHIIEL